MSWSDPCPDCENPRASCECFESMPDPTAKREVKLFSRHKLVYDYDTDKMHLVYSDGSYCAIPKFKITVKHKHSTETIDAWEGESPVAT